MKDLAKRIQHTNVAPDATTADIEKLCRECLEYGFDAAVVNPIWVCHAKKFLKNSDVKVCAALNFPIGGSTTLAKVVEIRNLAAMDVDEIDFMVNVGFLKSGMYDAFRADIEKIVHAADGLTVKAILETALLTTEEVTVAARICEECGVHYIKNSTGWGKGGPATVEIIKFMRSVVGQRVKIKASGGIRDPKTAIALLNAGADLLGSSRSVQIVTGKYLSASSDY
jgi:deoxyribose-phosphate aldolase